MFRRGKKYINEVSPEKQEKKRREIYDLSDGVSSRYELDALDVKNAYMAKPAELKNIFLKTTSATRWMYTYLSLVFLDVAAMGAIKRPIPQLLLLGGGAALGFMYNRNKVKNIRKKLVKQIDYHKRPRNTIHPRSPE